MRSVLLIEDDTEKSKHLVNYLRNEMSICDITIKRSWQTGIKEIIQNHKEYHCVLLDMSMPRYETKELDIYDEFEAFSGLDIIKEMKRRKIKLPVYVVTAFDVFGKDENQMSYKKLEKMLVDNYGDFVKGITFFLSKDGDWKIDILKFFEELNHD